MEDHLYFYITAIIEKHVQKFMKEIEMRYECTLQRYEYPEWISDMKFKYILTPEHRSVLAHVVDKYGFAFAKILRDDPYNPRPLDENDVLV